MQDTANSLENKKNKYQPAYDALLVRHDKEANELHQAIEKLRKYIATSQTDLAKKHNEELTVLESDCGDSIKQLESELSEAESNEDVVKNQITVALKAFTVASLEEEKLFEVFQKDCTEYKSRSPMLRGNHGQINSIERISLPGKSTSLKRIVQCLGGVDNQFKNLSRVQLKQFFCLLKNTGFEGNKDCNECFLVGRTRFQGRNESVVCMRLRLVKLLTREGYPLPRFAQEWEKEVNTEEEKAKKKEEMERCRHINQQLSIRKLRYSVGGKRSIENLDGSEFPHNDLPSYKKSRTDDFSPQKFMMSALLNNVMSPSPKDVVSPLCISLPSESLSFSDHVERINLSMKSPILDDAKIHNEK